MNDSYLYKVKKKHWIIRFAVSIYTSTLGLLLLFVLYINSDTINERHFIVLIGFAYIGVYSFIKFMFYHYRSSGDRVNHKSQEQIMEEELTKRVKAKTEKTKTNK